MSIAIAEALIRVGDQEIEMIMEVVKEEFIKWRHSPENNRSLSADTIIDERGRGFYRIRVRTESNHLGPEDDPLPIIPGMTAEVDILTGKRTGLDYLAKPFLKARYKALRER